MKVAEVVHVTWLDACAIAEWTEHDEFVEPDGITHSVGFLIAQGEKLLTLANTFDPETVCMNGLISIPRSCIIKITPIAGINLDKKDV